MSALTLTNAADRVGETLAVTDWVEITQDMVDGFAGSTLDPDWMHVDVERSRTESPFGGTIVQGFLVSSLVIHFCHAADVFPKDASYGLNYGTDKVRYLTPVLTGSRVRDHITLSGFEPRGEGRFLMRLHNVIELDGSEKPAAVLDWLTLAFSDLDY